jgi:hypothetical protein
MIVQCDNCLASVQAEEIGSYNILNEYDPMDGSRCILCKCVECLSPILIEQTLVWNSFETEWGGWKKIYPSNENHINPVIPEPLQKALTECTRCLRSGAYTATVIMCRRTLEGFCQVKGVKERSLDKAIKKLKEEGLINEQLFEWANQLRLSGNEAVHNIDANFPSADAQDILDFTIAILDFTYSFKDKFEKFKARRAKNGL